MKALNTFFKMTIVGLAMSATALLQAGLYQDETSFKAVMEPGYYENATVLEGVSYSGGTGLFQPYEYQYIAGSSTIKFSSGISGVGGDFTGISSITFYDSNNGSVTPSLITQYIGYTTDDPLRTFITALSFTAISGEIPTISNFTVGVDIMVPEPATWMAGTCLLGVMTFHLRRRKP